MTTPREDAIAALREAAQAVIASSEDDDAVEGRLVWYDALDALRAALGAEAETPKGIAETYTEGYEDGHRDAIDEVVTTNRLVDLASPETAEALARAVVRAVDDGYLRLTRMGAAAAILAAWRAQS